MNSEYENVVLVVDADENELALRVRSMKSEDRDLPPNSKADISVVDDVAAT